MSAQNEQQLLEDASTLLMFANAAARQRSPVPAPAQGQRTPSDTQIRPDADAAKNSTPLLLPALSNPANSRETTPSFNGYHQRSSSGHQPSSSVHQRHGLVHGSSGDGVALNQSPLSNPSNPIQKPQNPNMGTYQAPVRSQVPSPQANSPVGLGQEQNMHAPYSSQHATFHPLTLGSALGTARDSKSQGGSPTYEKGQNLPNPASAPSAPYKFPSQRLVPLSPKPPTSHSSRPANVAQNLNLSPRFSALPSQGSFRNSHKKAHSDGTQLKSKTPPSPALAFSRGINVESGQRRNDNAVIAAAALAAAADNPLPTFKQSPPAVMPAIVPGAQGKTEAEANHVLKAEDGVATEPEDENRTEDELPSAPADDHLVRIEGNPNDLVSALQAQDKVSKTEVPVSVKAEEKSSIPPLESYKVDPDAGTIGCICGIEEDDGFTIQCDLCFRWQHCSCMGYVNSDEVPEDEYKCYFCDELKRNKFDPEQCRIATIKRLDLDKVSEPAPEKPAPKRKSLSSGNEDKKRKRSDKDIKVERPNSEKRKSYSGTSPNINPVAAFEVNNKNNPLLEGGVTAEAYQNVYYRLGDYDYKTQDVKQAIQALGEAAERMKLVECVSAAQLKQVKFSKVILPNHLKYLQDRNELQKNKGHNKTSIKVKAYSDNPKQKFVGVSKIGLFITDSAAQTGAEVVIPPGTNVIEYLGEVDLWESHISNKGNQFPLWGTVKPKVARVEIPRSGADPMPVVLDARFVGNEARFIRKSCPSTANCAIRPVYVPHLQKFAFHVVTTKPIVLKGSSSDEELRILWEWCENHPIRRMLQLNSEGVYEEGQKFEDFTEDERATLVSCVDTILNFVECACNTSNLNHQCSIFKVKKATSYLLRSTRKLSSLSSSANNKSREELVMPKKSKLYVSWKDRLIERDNLLQASLLSPNSEVQDENGAEVRSAETDNVSQNYLEKLKIPFRKQLLAKAKTPLRKYEIAEDVTVEVNVTRVTSDTVQNSVAIPLTNKILKNIKDRINEAFEPLETTEATIVPTDSPTDVKKEIKTESPVAAVDLKVDEKPAIPPVKKKLSFADYKKKMK